MAGGGGGGAIATAIADAGFTFAWMVCVSTVGAATSIISSALGLQGIAPTLLITTFLIFFLLLIFNPVADLLGGASFNPTGNAAFYAAGLGSDSIFSLALRFPAQALGAAAGVLAIKELMPPQCKHTLSGPYLKVDLHSGAVAEGVLTFAITLAVLWIIVKGPRNPLIKTWLLASTTVTLVVAGSGYTGPSMNPANVSFSFFFFTVLLSLHYSSGCFSFSLATVTSNVSVLFF